MQIRSRNYIIASAVFCLLILGIVRVNLVYKWQLAPVMKAHRAIQAKELSIYKKDMHDLETNFPLRPVVFGKSDAGTLLNERIAWLPRISIPPQEISHSLSNLGGSESGKIVISDELRSDLIRYGTLYLDHPSHFAGYHPNLGFLSTLSRFDYWDIETRSPISELMAHHKFVPPNELPVPDPLDLISIAKLRLLASASESSVKPGLHDVRELARLMLTTENSQLITAGLSILEDERLAYFYYLKKAKIKQDDWTPIGGKLLSEARRAFDGTEGFLHLWTQDSTLDELFLKHGVPVGFCSALNNQIPAVMSLRDYLEPHLPFELDYRNEYRKFDEIMKRAKTNCRLRYLTELIRTDNFPAILPGFRLMNGAPYWRKLFALRALLADFSNFESYEKLTVISHQLFDNAPIERIPADD